MSAKCQKSESGNPWIFIMRQKWDTLKRYYGKLKIPSDGNLIERKFITLIYLRMNVNNRGKCKRWNFCINARKSAKEENSSNKAFVHVENAWISLEYALVNNANNAYMRGERRPTMLEGNNSISSYFLSWPLEAAAYFLVKREINILHFSLSSDRLRLMSWATALKKWRNVILWYNKHTYDMI